VQVLQSEHSTTATNGYQKILNQNYIGLAKEARMSFDSIHSKKQK
jgi:hypothetical protein